MVPSGVALLAELEGQAQRERTKFPPPIPPKPEMEEASTEELRIIWNQATNFWSPIVYGGMSLYEAYQFCLKQAGYKIVKVG